MKEQSQTSTVLENAEILDKAKATLETNDNLSNGSDLAATSDTEKTGDIASSDADCKDSFDDLIKGPYKEDFSKKVQEIINKRFKDTRKKESAENLAKEENATSLKEISPLTELDLEMQAAELIAMGYKGFDLKSEIENPKFKALVMGGVDVETAYKTLHFDEIMDDSFAFGAKTAAKQLADNIRFKSQRPAENGLSLKLGYSKRKGVSGLTPELRRELAKKSLMGEEISF